MNRVFFAVLAVVGIIVLRVLLLSEDSVLGMFITFGAAIGFFVWCGRMITNDKFLEEARANAYSDTTGSNQGFDPEVIAAGKRRADGIE